MSDVLNHAPHLIPLVGDRAVAQMSYLQQDARPMDRKLQHGMLSSSGEVSSF